MQLSLINIPICCAISKKWLHSCGKIKNRAIPLTSRILWVFGTYYRAMHFNKHSLNAHISRKKMQFKSSGNINNTVVFMLHLSYNFTNYVILYTKIPHGKCSCQWHCLHWFSFRDDVYIVNIIGKFNQASEAKYYAAV